MREQKLLQSKTKQRTKNLRQPLEGLRETNIGEAAIGFQEIKSIGMSRMPSSMTGWDITWFPPKGFRTTDVKYFQQKKKVIFQPLSCFLESAARMLGAVTAISYIT